MSSARAWSTWRTCRVFISSTFLDMHAERDYLVRRVMPRLRERLERQRIHLVDIDLRWGVTAFEVETNRALAVCLDWVRQSRPLFLGLLGQRYGWVPDSPPHALAPGHALTADDAGLSITELEVRVGVFQRTSVDRAVFAFRSDAAAESVPEPARSTIYVESAADRCAKLHALKDAIRHGGFRLIDGYACTWDPDTTPASDGAPGRLVGLESFGNEIERHLWDVITAEFELPPDSPRARSEPDDDEGLDWLAVEDDEQSRFVELRRRSQHGREAVTAALEGWCGSGESRFCLLTGASGIGKSTLLANLAARLSMRSGVDVVAHFTGVGRSSTDPVRLMMRLCRHIASMYALSMTLPSDQVELAAHLEDLLQRVPIGRELVLILDGLDRIDAVGGAQTLEWLPAELPERVRVVASCAADVATSAPARDALRARASQVIELGMLTREEQASIFAAFPSLTAKTLDSAQQRALLDNGACGNPLFLQTALEELRGLRSPAILDERIAALPRGERALAELFAQAFARLETDFGVDLARRTLTGLACARRGLSEAELEQWLAALARGDELFALLRQLRPYLVRRGALVGFYHDAVQRAVFERYLDTPAARRTTHRELAEFFFDAQLRRQAVELFWHLREDLDWARLYLVLIQPDLFLAMWQRDPSSVLECWTGIEQATALRLANAYALALKQSRQRVDFLEAIIDLFVVCGLLEQAVKVRERVVKHYRRTGDAPRLREALIRLAMHESQQGLFAEALAHIDEAEQCSGDQDSLAANCAHARCLVHTFRGDARAAADSFAKAEANYATVPGTGARADAAGMDEAKAFMLKDAGAFEEALLVVRRSQRRDARAGDALGLAISKNLEGHVLRELGRLDEAWECHAFQLAECSRLGHRQGVALALAGQARVASYRGNLDEAIRLHEAEGCVFEAIGDRAGLVRSLCGRTNALLRCRRFEEVVTLATQEIEQARAIDYRTSLAIGLQNRGDALLQLDRLSEAQADFVAAARVHRELGDFHEAAILADSEATALRLQHRPEEALSALRSSEVVFREGRRWHALAVNLLNQSAVLVQDLAAPDAATTPMAEAEALARKHGYTDLLDQAAKLRALT